MQITIVSKDPLTRVARELKGSPKSIRYKIVEEPI